MIIVCQNKNAIYNFSNVNCIMTRNVEGKCKIMLFDNTYSAEMGDGDCIGIYETEERAKEVLREIVDTFGIREIRNATYQYADIAIKSRKYSIYKMPKE